MTRRTQSVMISLAIAGVLTVIVTLVYVRYINGKVLTMLAMTAIVSEDGSKVKLAKDTLNIHFGYTFPDWLYFTIDKYVAKERGFNYDIVYRDETKRYTLDCPGRSTLSIDLTFCTLSTESLRDVNYVKLNDDTSVRTFVFSELMSKHLTFFSRCVRLDTENICILAFSERSKYVNMYLYNIERESVMCALALIVSQAQHEVIASGGSYSIYDVDYDAASGSLWVYGWNSSTVIVYQLLYGHGSINDITVKKKYDYAECISLLKTIKSRPLQSNAK